MTHRPLVLAAVLASALAAAPLAAQSHAQHQQHDAAKAAEARPSAVKLRVDDSVLTDQNGRQLKLKTDVFGSRIVVVDFVYTTCTTVCPVLSALMAQVQDALDANAARETRLVTITVDPARDTPARLKEYAARHGAKDGWLWLTGPTGRVNEVLKGFGAYTPIFEEHPPMVLVGDARSGEWARFFGLIDPRLVVAKVDELHARRAKDGHPGHDAHKH